MYKIYIVPDAALIQYEEGHKALYIQKQLLWDPYSESDVYAILEAKTKEEIGKAESLEFTVTPANAHYNDFYKRKTVLIIYDNDEWLFEGVVTDCPVDFKKQRKVTCTSALAYLCDSVAQPDEQTSTVIPGTYDNSDKRYIPVPTAWMYGEKVNPRGQNWYERTYVNDAFQFDRSGDTQVNWAKEYYYAPDTVGQGSSNKSNKTIEQKIPTTETIYNHIERLLDQHNSQVDAFKQIKIGTVVDGGMVGNFQAANYRTVWEALKEDITDTYGSYFTITLDENYDLRLNYQDIDTIAGDISDDNLPVLEFTNNMLDLTEADSNKDDIFTVLMPLGKDNITIHSSSNANDSPQDQTGQTDIDPYRADMDGKKRYIVVSKAALKKYGVIVKTQTFSDVSTPNDLFDVGLKYIYQNYDFHTEYDVKGIDLHIIDNSIDRIRLGHRCRILSQWHEIDERNLYVISAEHDLQNPENDSYTIGIPLSDKEANNRTLTGQMRNATASSKKAEAGLASSAGTMKAILDDYIKVTEWGLELSTNWRNERESADKMYKTLFEQDEEHTRMMATKVFGEESQDAGYVVVPSTQYQERYTVNGAAKWRNKIPSDEGWYIRDPETGKYSRCTIEDNTWTVGSDGLIYYTRNGETKLLGDGHFYMPMMWERVSQTEVGPGGIKARVDGNYERSIYCSSWINVNEDSIEALTGHLFIDDETGHIYVASGAGGRTTHSEDPLGVDTYFPVPKSRYQDGVHPDDMHWYEKNLNNDGSWKGDGQPNQSTNSAFYKPTEDHELNRSKDYFYVSKVKETFTAEYGVYDQGNLTAGVLAKTINNPSYVRVKLEEKNNAVIRHESPQANHWFEYDARSGTFGVTDDTEVLDLTKEYYKLIDNNDQTYTAIKGKNIVIGASVDYDDPDGFYTQFEHDHPGSIARVKGYLTQNGEDLTLDQSITWVASDIMYVDTLLAKYVGADDIEAHSSLRTDYFKANDIKVFNTLVVLGDHTGDEEICFEVEGQALLEDVTVNKGLNADVLATNYLNLNGIEFGEAFETEDEQIGQAPSNIVMGFGEATYSGDTVTIPFYTTSDYNDEEKKYKDNEKHVLTFIKPASLGNAVWSSGGHLNVYTVGGWNNGSPTWNFYRAIIDIPTVYEGTDSETNPVVTYARTGSQLDAGMRLATKPTLKVHMEIRGDDYNKDNNPVAFPHDSEEDSPLVSEWCKYVFVDATDAYNDGYSQASYDYSAKDIQWAYDSEHNHELMNVRAKKDNMTIASATLDIAKHYYGDSNIEYERAGSSFADLNNSLMNSMKVIKTTLQITGTWTGEAHDGSESDPHITAWERPIFVDATKPYDDGHTQGLYDHSVKDILWKYENNHERFEVKANDNTIIASADLDITKYYYGAAVSYNRSGSSFPNFSNGYMSDKPVIKTTLNITGTWTGESHDSSESDPDIDAWEKPIYVDAKPAYDDGHAVGVEFAKSKFDILSEPIQATTDNTSEGERLGNATVLDYGKSYMYYSLYDNARYSSKRYFRVPSKGSFGAYYTDEGGTKWLDDQNALSKKIGYDTDVSGNITIYGYRIMDGYSANQYDRSKGITITGPSKGDFGAYYNDGTGILVDKDTALEKNLTDNESVVIYGWRQMDDEDVFTSSNGITVSSPKVRVHAVYEGSNYFDEDTIQLEYEKPVTINVERETAPESNIWAFTGEKIIVSPPEENELSVHSDNIYIDGNSITTVNNTTISDNYVNISANMADAIGEAYGRYNRYVKFTVTCLGASRTFAFKC